MNCRFSHGDVLDKKMNDLIRRGEIQHPAFNVKGGSQDDGTVQAEAPRASTPPPPCPPAPPPLVKRGPIYDAKKDGPGFIYYCNDTTIMECLERSIFAR
jgi:hypothetical protein